MVGSPRGPIANSFSPSPSWGYNASPGRPLRGSPMSAGARGPPMNSMVTPSEPASGHIPAVGFGALPGRPPGGGSPGVSPMNIAPRGPTMSILGSPYGPPRGLQPNNISSGGDFSVSRGGVQGELSGGFPTDAPGTPRDPPMDILPGYPRGLLPSPFPTDGFGASSEKPSGAPLGESPMRPPDTPSGRLMNFPGRPITFFGPPEKPTSPLSLGSLGESPVCSPGGLARAPPARFGGPTHDQIPFPFPLRGNDGSQTGTPDRQTLREPTDEDVGDGERNENGEEKEEEEEEEEIEGEEEECDNYHEGAEDQEAG